MTSDSRLTLPLTGSSSGTVEVPCVTWLRAFGRGSEMIVESEPGEFTEMIVALPSGRR